MPGVRRHGLPGGRPTGSGRAEDLPGTLQAVPRQGPVEVGLADATGSRAAGQLSKGGDYLRQVVGLGEETAAFRQIVFTDADEAGSRNDLDRRPSPSDKSCELQPVHGTRHLNVGKNDVDVRPRFEYGNRFVGVRGLDNVEPGVTDHFRSVHPQQEVVFHNQNEGSVDC